jgi:Skp family chaperone for outer membrane proteins
MKAFTVVAALSFALMTVPALAQQKPPAKPPATPLTQPAPQKPIMPPAPQTQQPPKPFPEGAKIAYCSLQEISQSSKAGQAAAAQLKALNDKKVKELDDKRKQIEASTTLMQSPSLADDKRAALQRDIDRGNTDLQRMQQDAQAEWQELNNELQKVFMGKLNPIIQQLATEKGLQLVFLREESGLLWLDPGLDLSAEITKRLDAANTAPPKAPVPDASAPPPPATRR